MINNNKAFKWTKKDSKSASVKTYVSGNVSIVIEDKRETHRDVYGLKGNLVTVRNYKIYKEDRVIYAKNNTNKNVIWIKKLAERLTLA